MPKFLLTWIVTAVSLLITGYIIPGITIQSVTDAAIAAIVFALVNNFVKPILVFFTFPLTILTLGLFLLVVNAICLSLVGYFTPGVEVNTFLDALFGSILLSLVSGFFSQMFNDQNQ